MFRNQYDTDVTTWSPQGRLHQVLLRLAPPGKKKEAQGSMRKFCLAGTKPCGWKFDSTVAGEGKLGGM